MVFARNALKNIILVWTFMMNSKATDMSIIDDTELI